MSVCKTRAARGLTLLEVVLALAILAAASATLAQLVGIGLRAAAQARDTTEAQLMAESLMSEIAAGITLPDQISSAPLPDDSSWLASAFVQPATLPGVLQVTLLVERDPQYGGRPSSFQLTRWIRDPQLPYPVEEEEETSSTGTTGEAGNAASQDASATGDGTTAGMGMPMGAAPNGGGRGGRGQGGRGQGGRGDGQGGRGQGGGRGEGGRGGGGEGGGQGGFGGPRGGGQGGSQGGGGPRGGGQGAGGGRGGFGGGGQGGGGPRGGGPGGGGGGQGGGPGGGGGPRGGAGP